MSGIFKNPGLLDERSSEKDLVGFAGEVGRIGGYLRRIVDSHDFAVIALLGAFGSGKTSALDQIKKNKDQKWVWFKFEIWKYPDRKQIWDNFVIELVAELNDEDPLHTARAIDGHPSKAFVRQSKLMLSAVCAVCLAATYLLSVLVLWFVEAKMIPPVTVGYTGLYIKYGLPVFTSIFIFALVFFRYETIIKNSYISKSLSRVFELQARLKSQLNKFHELNEDKALIIEIEDVDRAGKNDEGQVFVETLRYFIDELQKDSQLKMYVIIPQRSSSFIDYSEPDINLSHRYLKAYTHSVYFVSTLFKSDIAGFFKELGVREDEAFFIDATTRLAGDYKEEMNLRLVKFVLRQTDEISFLAGNGSKQIPNEPKLLYLLLMSRYLYLTDAGETLLSALRHGSVSGPRHDTFFRLLLGAGGYGDVNDVASYSISFGDLGDMAMQHKTSGVVNQYHHVVINERYQDII